VLGIEGPEGTDSLIDRCADVDGEMGGVLVKMRKPGQDDRVDLPSIGLETLRRCVAANISGIAVEAHGALVMDQDALRQKADVHGFFVTAFVEGQTPDTP
jgi:DUF1009 family protein